LASPNWLVTVWKRLITETYLPDARAPTQAREREATDRMNKQWTERTNTTDRMDKQPTERTSKQATERTNKQAREQSNRQNKATDREQSNRQRNQQSTENKYILKEKAAATDGDYINKNKIKNKKHYTAFL
jgi:hypothetical protein